MNASHLENEDYKQGVVDIKNNIDSTLDALLKWVSFKINVRDYSIKFAKQSKYNVKHKIKIIEDRIYYIENLPSSDMNEKRELEQELDSIYDNISESTIQRFRWFTR